MAATLVVACSCLLGSPGRTLATTGATSPTPARYKLAASVSQALRGQYNLVTSGQSGRLSSGAMALDLNSLGYLFGVCQLRTYDSQGNVTTVLFGLYNFHTVAHSQLQVTFYDMTDTVVLGSMAVTSETHGNLVGQLTLGHQRYAVSWHKNISL